MTNSVSLYMFLKHLVLQMHEPVIELTSWEYDMYMPGRLLREVLSDFEIRQIRSL